MYMTRIKTMLVEGIEKTFSASYPVTEFRNIHTSIEFPMKKQSYPGIWVDWNPLPTGLQIAGIGHIEYEDGDEHARAFTRWNFKGEASFTLVALTSLERDRLHDEMVRIIAFGRENPGLSIFRNYMEDNPWVGCSFDWDEITVRGMNENVGTPWGTDDLIYEVEIAMECVGDFVSDNQNQSLIKLSDIEVFAYTEHEEGDPIFNPESDPDDEGGWE